MSHFIDSENVLGLNFRKLASQYTTMGSVRKNSFNFYYPGIDHAQNNEQVDQYLYDPNLLNSLDFRKSPAILKPYITAADPGEPWMKVRPLR